MTSPAQIGFPDWQPTFATARNVLVNVAAQVVNVSNTFGPFPTANMDSIGLMLVASSAGGVQMIMTWSLDAAGTVVTASEIFGSNNGSKLNQSVTVKGSFVTFSIFPKPAGPQTYSLTAYEATRDFVAQENETANVLMSNTLLSVGASSSTALTTTRQWGGPAVLFAFSNNATAWRVELTAIISDGTFVDLLRVDNTLPIQSQLVFLPPTKIRINHVNNDAAARTFNSYLTAKPLYP